MKQSNVLLDPKVSTIEEQLHLSGCSYGLPDGPDDFITDCECKEL